MAASLDNRANYDRKTESVRTGDGRFVRIRDLYAALATLNAVQLNRLIKQAKLAGIVGDPYVDHRSSVVKDISDLCRSRPQFCLPIIRTARRMDGVATRFEGLFRSQAFGASAQAEVVDSGSLQLNPHFEKSIGTYFWETRDWTGEYQALVSERRRVVTLSQGEQFSSAEPYQLCFSIVRTPDLRYWLKWPSQHLDVPAYYFDETETLVGFFPHEIPGETSDFEELFPGHIYEVYGVQFQLPDLGLDYSEFEELFEEMFEEWDPHQAAADRRRADRDKRAEAGEPVPPPSAAMSEEERLWATLELYPGDVSTRKGLSKQFRELSRRYHPLKHLDADPETKAEISARYLAITVAYNTLKGQLPA